MKHLYLIVIILFILSCSQKPADDALGTQLNHLFTAEFSPDEPGGSVLIKKGDQIAFLKSYGLADLETQEPITENTIFNTGSISKTFVSNGVLILQERDSLSIEDKLSKYFDDFDDQEIADNISIKDLLSHTSGLPDLRDVGNNVEFYLTAKDQENWEPIKRADGLVFETGEKFQYSNPAYNGLALIIEQIAQEPWQDFVQKNIFDPAGMKDSKITNGSYPESGVAHAYANYYFEGDSVYYGDYYESDYGEVPTFAAAGNGGVWSTVLDLAKYEEAIQQNTFLSKEMIEESRTVYRPENWADTADPFIGYSWFMGEQSLMGTEDKFDVKIVYHTGSQGGFRAFYVTVPEKDIFFVGLFNRPLNNFRELIARTMTLLKENNWLEEN